MAPDNWSQIQACRQGLLPTRNKLQVQKDLTFKRPINGHNNNTSLEHRLSDWILHLVEPCQSAEITPFLLLRVQAALLLGAKRAHFTRCLLFLAPQKQPAPHRAMRLAVASHQVKRILGMSFPTVTKTYRRQKCGTSSRNKTVAIATPPNATMQITRSLDTNGVVQCNHF